MRHLLLTIWLMTLVSLSGISQDSKAVFFTHKLGKFHLYINSQLIERAPANQVAYESSYGSKLLVKVIFQDHNLQPIQTEIKLKKGKTMVYVIYADRGEIKMDLHEKIKVGQYRPGFIAPNHNAMPSYKGRLGCDYPCSPSIVALAVNQMKTESTEMAQTTIARELVVNNCITVDDLKHVLNAFPYETDKVQFAKFAWAYIYDQENYYQLGDSFQFAQTLEEIITFVHTDQ